MLLKQDKQFNKRLSRTLTLIFTLTILLTVVSLSAVFYFQSIDILVSTLGNKALDIAKASAEKVNIEEYLQMNTVEDMEKQSYENLGQDLNHIREISGAEYLYIMKQNENGEYIYVIEASDFNSEEPTTIGEVEKTYPGFSTVMTGESYVDDSISVDEYGALISAYYPLFDDGGEVVGFVGLDYQVNTAHNSFKKFERLIIFLGLGLCAIIVIIGYLISRHVSKPIKQASKISEKIANYDLSATHININNKDEIGLLAYSINHMIENLKDIVSKVKGSSEILKQSTNNLNVMTDESTKSVESITSSINEISTGSESTAYSINELNNMISSFSATMQQTVVNTIQASKVSDEMKFSASKGQDAVANIIDKIELINKSTENTSNVIGELNNEVQNINDIVQVINNISEQTNLLALNANIEAARAGDAGRGFGVVAEEVRKLAEETQNYSKEITSMISSIISSTENAVDSMSNVKSIVNEGITAANVSNDVFNNLHSKINETSELVNDITKASEEQAENSNNILERINDVSAISEQTSSTCQNSAAAAEETLASIEEITTLTDNLKTIAASLNEIVSKFEL